MRSRGSRPIGFKSSQLCHRTFCVFPGVFIEFQRIFRVFLWRSRGFRGVLGDLSSVSRITRVFRGFKGRSSAFLQGYPRGFSGVLWVLEE